MIVPGLIVSLLLTLSPMTPTNRLPVIEATDTAALRQHVGQRVFVVGTVERAAWSRSGKVMNVEFEGVGDDGFLAAMFARSRKSFDAAFSGDAAAAFTGRRVRVMGELQLYGGNDADLRGRPEIILALPSQINLIADDAMRPAA